jgi:hypothetical protein
MGKTMILAKALSQDHVYEGPIFFCRMTLTFRAKRMISLQICSLYRGLKYRGPH